MYKQIMLLGLLMERPMYGQQIREVIETHHHLFADHIKKPTIYYQLEQMARSGYLEIRHEAVAAPGPGAAHDDIALRERDVYYITEEGRRYFYTLLRKTLSAYTPDFSEVDASLFFLHYLPRDEAIALLTERQSFVAAYRAQVVAHIAEMEAGGHLDDAHRLVNDHKLALVDAELRWLEHMLAYLTAPRGS